MRTLERSEVRGQRAEAREKIFARIALNHHRLLGFDPQQSCDAKLLKLGAWVGDLANRVAGKNIIGTQHALEIIAAHCVGWVDGNPGNIKDVFTAIAAERGRQIELRTDNPQRYTFDLAHPFPDPQRKFRVLFEEAGEVARECDHLEQTPKSRKVWPFLRDELIQTAAVCVAWLESLEVQS